MKKKIFNNRTKIKGLLIMKLYVNIWEKFFVVDKFQKVIEFYGFQQMNDGMLYLFRIYQRDDKYTQILFLLPSPNYQQHTIVLMYKRNISKIKIQVCFISL